jgi:hypothetical protein
MASSSSQLAGNGYFFSLLEALPSMSFIALLMNNYSQGSWLRTDGSDDLGFFNPRNKGEFMLMVMRDLM